MEEESFRHEDPIPPGVLQKVKRYKIDDLNFIVDRVAIHTKGRLEKTKKSRAGHDRPKGARLIFRAHGCQPKLARSESSDYVCH
jgi:hypothetical protein